MSTTVFSIGCSKDKGESPKSDIARFLWLPPSESFAQIKILNAFSEPIVGAKVLIGSAEGIPFEKNFLTTDESGTVRVYADWTTTAHVTVDAPGFIRQTLLNQHPGDITLKMNPLYQATRPEVKGQVTGLPVVNGDKQIDFALVTPAMSRQDLLNFDMNTVISPYVDTISIIGQKASIPGNVSLPTQKESYIIGITLSKPVYRLTTPTYGAKRFFAVRGQFPFKKVLDEMKNGKPFYELVNHFSIQGGGMHDVILTNPLTNIDIPGNELLFSSKIKTQPANSAADEVLMVVAVSEVADSLVPTDIKKFSGETVLNMSSLPNRPAYIVNVIKRQADFDATLAPGSDRLSASISPHLETVKPLLLPLIENPVISSTNGYKITLPPKPEKVGIFGIATSASISDLIETQNGDEQVLSVNRRWEILGLGWESQIDLPQWPLGKSTSRQRVEVNYLGSTTHQSVHLDDQLINATTHVTHASADF
ncbi:MAG: hypothetical protein A2622_01615 [Bdellovibrionales bacterium RIFCSPHIGHO2_01_FULL_40_29]|nr:MAG: hypothetical protein A2622_01615 [Bdellovibrionales bacterium RIFCSPHIGHO2_01_FULL_40_29]OFZ33793.1 MAG: hypothetical protein A3D17_02035 [Bdellovibrionales bacterium RIFCSPHIGHO2_02_FULL_40_15]